MSRTGSSQRERAVPRPERLARLVTVLLLLALPAGLLASRLRDAPPSTRVIDLIAREPAAGGWSAERIVVNRGDRVRLRIRSEDVVHGFAIGRLGVNTGRIEPGKPAVVEFDAAEAGEFTFYCTVWCDPNHPRMRGVLEIRDHGRPLTSARPARDVALQHADAPHPAPVVPPARPSAARGHALYTARCAACHGRVGEASGPDSHREWLQERSPAQAFLVLAASPSRVTRPAGAPISRSHAPAGTREAHHRHIRDWSEQDRWDAVAYLWSLGTTADRLELGRRLYRRNCAACHGESGAGDGPGGRVQPKAPASFTQARTMLGGAGALYTAKIRRGGMGTGMPYWGSIFTEEEITAIVDYLWTFTLGTSDRF